MENARDTALASPGGSAGRPSSTKSSPAPAAPPASAPAPLRTSKPLVAATPGCQPVFVAFYTVQPGTPADYDFPATRSALRHRTEFASVNFVEVDLNHHRVFGALTPSYDLGQRLAQFVKVKVAGSAPQVLCGEPVILRSVPIRIGD
jgi:hypothetical protein